MNFYKHHLGDYSKDTAHLSWMEDMAYTRALRVYYLREKPLPLDKNECDRLLRAVTRREKEAVTRILSEFFSKENDGYHNQRADQEIDKYQAQASTNRRIARQRTVNEPSNDSPTNGTPNQNQIPEPDTRTRVKKGADAPDWLPPEWGEYLQHRAEKKSKFTPTAQRGCIKKLDGWRSQGHDVSAILRYAIDNGYTGLFLPNSIKNKQESLEKRNRNATENWMPPEDRNAA